MTGSGKGKGLSIGAAMKNRMKQPAPESPVEPREPEVAVVPAETLESFNCRLRSGLHRRLKMHAVAENRKIQDVVNEALEAYLSQKERK